MKHLRHQENVVITGATAGVGRATARWFAERGANIAVFARGEERLRETKAELENLGVRCFAQSVDVADADALEAATELAEENLGPIDIWINNAMVSVFSYVKNLKPEEFRRVTEVTYLGSVYGALCALRRMLPRDHGKIVFVGSALAYRGIPLQAPYCAAKHAIQGFVDSLRSELLHDRSSVDITMVQLPAHNTPQFDWVKSNLPRKAKPVPPIFQPEVAAEAIYWAAHNKRRELYVGFPAVKAIVGNKIAPGYADHYLAEHGIESQQTEEPEIERPDNLWDPAPGRYAAHGRFDSEAHSFSPQLWFTTKRRELAAAAAVLGVGLAARKALKGNHVEDR